MNRIKKTQCSRKDCSDRGDVIFRKVSIPSTFGDELTGSMKPENGAYKNALVFYEASGVSFLYDSDGVYTKIANIEGQDSGVISVNGKQGVVTITLAELGGMTEAQINALITGKGYQTASQVDIKVNTAKSGAIAESKAYTDTKATTAKNEAISSAKTYTDGKIAQVESEIPTKTSDLTNDSNFQTLSQVNAKVAAEATARAAAITAVENKIPDVIDNVTSTSTDDALSAKQGKLLNDRIDNIDSRGRYLSTWNATTGEPGTEPEVIPYEYRTGDYFIVATVGSTNYRPVGSQYTGTASTTVETDTVSPNDTYLYDGTTWELIHTEIPQIAVDENFSTTSRNPVENRTITNAINDIEETLDEKQDELTAGGGITISNNTITYDPDVLSTVDYVDGSITNTLTYVDQQDTNEHNGRVAGDNLINAKIGDLSDLETTEKTELVGAINEVLEGIPELLDTTGQSTTAGMTQKAITDALASAGGGAKVLTTADYNWPTDNPNGVALWLLDAGLYTADNTSTKVYSDTGMTSSELYGFNYWLVTKKSDYSFITIYGFGSPTAGTTTGYNSLKIEFIQTTGVKYSVSAVLNDNSLMNALTFTSTGYALDARQGKVLKDLIDSLIIKGSGAPTTATVGTVGKLYEDSANGKLYQCTAASGSTYTWEEVGGGSGGQTLYDTVYGTNTDGSPTQAAISSALSYNNTMSNVRIGTNKTVGSGNYNVVIGGVENVSGSSLSVAIGHDVNTQNSTRSVAVGNRANAKGYYRTAIGEGADAQADCSIALGAYSTATQAGEMNIGTPQNTTSGYNGTAYRLLTGLHDPVNDHDAATKKYVDEHGGGGGCHSKNLTSADYNWPTSNPDGVALWLMPTGTYGYSNDVKVYFAADKSGNYDGLSIVKQAENATDKRGTVVELDNNAKRVLSGIIASTGAGYITWTFQGA